MRVSCNFFLAIAAASLTFSTAATEALLTSSVEVSFYKQIRPILQAHCQGCHQPAKAKGGYVMTDFKGLLAGGDDEGLAVVPGKPSKSTLLMLITPDKNGETEMPKGKNPLHSDEIKLIKKWITEGAKDDTPANAKNLVDANHPPIYTLPPVITSLDYSPDGSLLAVAGYHEVLLHKADGSGLAARLIGLSERIESVRFSPDGKWLAVTGGNPARMGEVQVWGVAQQKLALSHPVTFDTVYGASWSPDGQAIAFGCADNTVRAINAKTGEQIFYQGAHTDWVFDTVYDTKGEHLISVGRDMTTKLTVFKSSRFIDNITSITPKALKGGLATIARHPKRNHILVGGSDGAPQIFRIFRQTKRVIGDNANLIRKFPDMPGRVLSVRYSKDGSVFAAGSGLDGKGQVVIYSANVPDKIPDDIKKIMAKRVQQRKPQEIIKVDKFQTDSVKEIAKVDVPDSGIYALAISPSGKTVAAAGSDGQVRFINAMDGKVTKAFVPVNVEKAGVAKSTVKAPTPKPDIPVKESLPKDVTVQSLMINPKTVALTSPVDYAQILVSAKLSTGDVVDVTRLAKLKLSGAATVSLHGIVTPVKDGSATLTVELGGKSASAPVKVSGKDGRHKADYIRDVMPVLSKVGCNAGTCHGAKDGKNGFKLSLRGYDPIYDVRAFTDEIASRRVNLASPDNSLMLMKTTAAAPHTGGQVIPPGGKYYRIIHNWIANGAKLDLKSPRVRSISLSPENPVVQKLGSRQQFRVVATYADGSMRDVTAEAVIESGNKDIATHDKRGLLTTLRRGEAPVLARFEGAYSATTLTAMGDRSGFVWKQPKTWNKIDELTAAKWKRMKILPSVLCADVEFLRRVHLDLTGLPPTADAVKKFIADKRETRTKRDELINQLIGSEEYIDRWSNKWADLLQVNRKFLGPEGSKMFREWIRNEIKANTPYDEFARKVLTATGSNKENPPASYYKILRKPTETMENTTHLWLATRFNCNKCHDHPFERWTQDQYYEMTAFFAQVGLKKDSSITKAAKAAATQLATAKSASTKATAEKMAAAKALTAAKAAQTAAQKTFDTSDKAAKDAEASSKKTAEDKTKKPAEKQASAKHALDKRKAATTSKGVLDKAVAATKAAETKASTANNAETAAKVKQAAAKKKSDELARVDKATVGGTAVEGKKPLYEEVYDKKDGETKHQRTGAVTPPTFPFTTKFEAQKDATRREQLSAWITSPDNRYFAKSYVNRIWGYLLGVGIIEPIDDIRAGNPPTNPELLDWLTADFISHKFDVRHLIRTICQSRTYQLSIKTHEWNVDDTINYSHAIARRLPAEVLYDAIYFTTGTQSKFPGVPPGTRAAALPDAGVKLADGFLGNLGRPPRESACECERINGLQLGPVMALITGPTVDTAISDPNNAITKLVKEQKDDRKLVDQLFLRILNRHATENEIASSLKLLASIEPEHKSLLAEKAKYEKELIPILAAKEKVRQVGIVEAKKAVDDFKKSIAAREAEAEKKQKASITAADKVLKDYQKGEDARFIKWIKQGGDKSAWTTVDAKEMKSKIGTKLAKEKDGVIFASGKNDKDTFTITAETTMKNLTGLRLEALPDKRLPKGGPGRAPGDGNFVLTELELMWAPADKPKEQKKLKLEKAKADFSQGNYAVATAIDGKLAPTNNGWAIAPQMNKPHQASFEIKDAPKNDGPILLTIIMKQEFTGRNWQLGKFRWSITDGKKPVNFGLPKNINDLLAIAPDKRDDKQKKTLLDFFRGQDDQLIKLKATLANAKKPRPADPKIKVLQDAVARAEKPLPIDPQLTVYKRAVDLSTKQLTNKRLYGAQDITWALINNPAFLFNH